MQMNIWHNNPIYQKPEDIGMNWFDQINHWNPSDENIQSTVQGGDPIPYWSQWESNHEGIRSLWDGDSHWDQENMPELFPEQPEMPTPSAPPTELIQGDPIGKMAMIGGPELQAAWAVSQALGKTASTGLSSDESANTTKNFIQDSAKPGIHSDKHAMMNKAQSDNYNKQGNDFRTMGTGVAGLIGSILGHAAHTVAHNDRISYNQGKTAFSPEGRVNPQDSNIVNSLNSGDPSLETQ